MKQLKEIFNVNYDKKVETVPVVHVTNKNTGRVETYAAPTIENVIENIIQDITSQFTFAIGGNYRFTLDEVFMNWDICDITIQCQNGSTPEQSELSQDPSKFQQWLAKGSTSTKLQGEP